MKPRESCLQLRGTSLENPDAHIPEARGRGAVPGAHHLHRLAFATVWRAPQFPVFLVTDGIARIPELRSHSGVGAVAQHTATLSMLDFEADLGTELEV